MIGVAISTHARPYVLAEALGHWALHMPDILVVNHDVNGKGVAVTKNRGLAALMDAGCDHLFLADDDIWPVSPNWADLYVADDEPHLMHCWGKSRYLSTDGPHTVWRHPRGVLLYVERRVVDEIGGMRTEFGRWGGEHVEWSRRIHHAGFTTYRYADLAVANKGKRRIWHALDYTREVPSTVSEGERLASIGSRHALYEKYAGTMDYVPYREGAQ